MVVLTVLVKESPKDHSYEVSLKLDKYLTNNRLLKDFTKFDPVN